jgi:hypothetical protein
MIHLESHERQGAHRRPPDAHNAWPRLCKTGSMRHRIRSLVVLVAVAGALAACGAKSPDAGAMPNGSGGTTGAPEAAAPLGSDAAGGGAANADGSPDAGRAECVAATMPSGAPSLSIYLAGVAPNAQATVDGYVFVEHAAPGELDLVGEAGQRITVSLTYPNVALEQLAIGSRLWLSAYVRDYHPNPFASEFSAFSSLRTDKGGPVLLAQMVGMSKIGDDFLGAPLSVSPMCKVQTVLVGQSTPTGIACSSTVERFQIVLSANSTITVNPGTVASGTIGGHVYDMALPAAETTTYSDTTCQPLDWAPSLNLRFDVVTRDWSALVAGQPVFVDQLPACRLGTDQPPFELDVNALNWKAMTSATLESAMTLTSSTADAMTFALPNMGTVTVSGLSGAGRTVLARGRWFSILGPNQYVIRDGQGGRTIAVSMAGRSTEVAGAMSALDVLDLSISFEARCTWLAAGCQDGVASKPLSLYDVIYGDSANHRIPSYGRTTITSGGQTFDAWMAVRPSCSGDPMVRSSFLATQ